MNADEHIPMPDSSIDTIDADDTASVDDFIRELEAKEKDLHITADLKIEVAETGFDFSSEPEFAKPDPPPAPEPPAVHRPATDNVSAATKVRNFELENEVAALKVRILELKAERSDMQEKSDRRLKDFENFKYRVDRERRGSFIEQISKIGAQLLPVLDNLDRALDSAGQMNEEKGPEYQQFYDGIVLVNQQVNEVFAGLGIQPIVTSGERFDPNFHEAVAVEERSDVPVNTITGEMLRGYRIGNKVIRHSMVRVTVAPKPELKPGPPHDTDTAGGSDAESE
jgi:molecular chaperone GrpE